MRVVAYLALFCLAGIGAAQAQSPPYEPIPAPRYEPIPPAPGSRFVWQPGHWQWNGTQYIWIAGHYTKSNPQRLLWVEGHWVWSAREQRWNWRPPHWQ